MVGTAATIVAAPFQALAGPPPPYYYGYYGPPPYPPPAYYAPRYYPATAEFLRAALSRSVSQRWYSGTAAADVIGGPGLDFISPLPPVKPP